MKFKLKFNYNLFVFVLGIVLFSIGCYFIYPPLAYLAAGVILMGISVFGEGGKAGRQ